MENKNNGFLNKKISRSNLPGEIKGKGDFKIFKKNDNIKENLNNFNTGEFKKKYDKKYILEKLNKNADLKSRFNKNKFPNKTRNQESITHNNLKLTLTEDLFRKAKAIYEQKVKLFYYFVII